MYLYNSNGKRIRYDLASRIGGEAYGNIYKLSDEECLKVYKGKPDIINKEILEYIKKLNLKRFYEIHELLYNKNNQFKAHTMKYYLPEEIDILTEPIDYTLSNIFNILDSVNTLTQNNILICDMHTGNIIINNDGITIIDTDLYTFNKFYVESTLRFKNISALQYLFQEIYFEAMKKYHSEYYSHTTSELIKNLFRLYSPREQEETHKKLTKCKYPIDYIKINSRH